MQFPQVSSRLDAKLLDKRSPGILVDGKRVGLAAAPVQGQHELGAEPLPERVCSGQRLKLGNELPMAAQVQPGVGSHFDCLQTQLLQPRQLVASEQLRRDISQRTSPPERERLRQRRPRICPRACAYRSAAVVTEPAELQQVHLVLGGIDHVTGRTRQQPGPCPRPQRPPQPHDVRAHGRCSPARRGTFPEHFDELVQRYGLGGADQHRCEHDPLPGCGNGHGRVSVVDLQRPPGHRTASVILRPS